MARATGGPEAFERFLTLLDPADREAAGLRYEELRLALIRLFRWRGCGVPEDLADETLGRAAEKSLTGPPIQDITRFVHGIARLIALEGYKQQSREQRVLRDASGLHMAVSNSDPRLDCLHTYLDALPAADREVIVSYYTGDRGEKIEKRRRLAESIHVSVMTLRVRAHRLRERLEVCLNQCLERE